MTKVAIRHLWICLILILPIKAVTQDVASLLREAERLEYGFREADALQKYMEVLRIQPTNLAALCKSSDLSSRVGHREANKTKKSDFFHQAKKYAELALKVNPYSPEANFVMAVAMGRMAMLTGGKEKIQYVSEIKRYAETTLKYDPNNFKALHVLGKWHYEVSNLNSFERTMARIMFGGLPKASLQEAINYYEKSRSLEPNFSLNYLELAKAYHRNHEDKKAIDLLVKLQTLPNKIEDDARIKQEAKNLLEEVKQK
jgi:tetratricopeptide (TPR) repeat protein